MKIMYKGGFTQKELENYAELLLSRTVLSMHALIRATKQLKIRTGSRLKVCLVLSTRRLSAPSTLCPRLAYCDFSRWALRCPPFALH